MSDNETSGKVSPEATAPEAPAAIAAIAPKALSDEQLDQVAGGSHPNPYKDSLNPLKPPADH